MPGVEATDQIFVPQSVLAEIAEQSEFPELKQLFYYASPRSPDRLPNEDFYPKLVTLLTDPKTPPFYKRFLMANLGLGDIWANQERGTVCFRPAAKGYPLVAISVGEGAQGVGFGDLKYVAGRMILDFARDPYITNPTCRNGCKIIQLTKSRELRIDHEMGIVDLLGIAQMEITPC